MDFCPEGTPLLSFAWKVRTGGTIVSVSFARHGPNRDHSKTMCVSVRKKSEICYLIITPRTLILDALVRYVIFHCDFGVQNF